MKIFLKFVLNDIYIRLSSLFYSRWHIIPTGGALRPLGITSYSYEGGIQLIPTRRLPIP